DIRRLGAIKHGDEVIGSRTKVKVVKNKVAPPFREAEFDILYGTGISKEGELIDIASEQGILEKTGAWYAFQGERIGQGRENARYPVYRVRGTLIPWDEAPRLDRDTMVMLSQALLSESQCMSLHKNLQVDAGYGHAELGRFRVNVFYQRGELQAALRLIPPRVRQIRELNLPPIIERVASERRGLVLVTGTTGSGKSTTLAAMIDHINRTAD